MKLMSLIVDFLVIHTVYVEKSKILQTKFWNHILSLISFYQLNLKEKDSQLQEIKRSMSDKEERISQLEQELERSRAELDERERRVAELLKVEVL